MVASVLGVAGFIALLLLALGLINPVLGAVITVLLLAPLAVVLAGRLFSHAGTSAVAGTPGPAVPSTADAAYDPVADPAERG